MWKSLGRLVWVALLFFPVKSSFADAVDIERARGLLTGEKYTEARDLLLACRPDSSGETSYLQALALLGAGDLPGVGGLDSASALFERSARAGYRYPDQPWAYPGI